MLPEVFGVNAWVRSVADRLAAQGIPALAVPLFARTAPELELAYETSDLAQGRAHKDATTASQILSDVSAAVVWLQQRCPHAAIDLAGFCFGGHAALLAATLPQIRRSFDFYGAGVSRMRPGGGPFPGVVAAGVRPAHLSLRHRRSPDPRRGQKGDRFGPGRLRSLRRTFALHRDRWGRPRLHV